MSKTVFAFGRMNPPTIGHEKLAAKVESEAKRRGAMPHIYLSHTQNSKKDPLPYNTKIAIAKKAFGKAVTKSSAKNVIQIMQDLEKMGHTEVIMVAGSDRVPEFKTLLGKYNGKEYNFKKIDVVSAGERDPDAQGVEGMSASKLRAIAQSGDYETFAKGMPSKLRDADKKKVYNTIRSVMEEVDPTDEELDEILDQIEEDEDLFWEWDEDEVELEEERKPLTLQQRMKKRILMRRLAPIIARKRKIRMRRRAGKEQLTKRARRAALILLKKRVAGNKGKEYKKLSPSEKIGIDRLVQKKLPMVDRIAKRLLPKMMKKETERMRKRSSGIKEEFETFLEKRRVAQDPDVDERPGTQPKKYYSGVRKKTKDDRARHFERGAKMDDDNPAAYTPAPGDAEGKTKPSKHTKKFKQMYGEEVTAKQISDLEKFGDRLLDKFGVDIEFSKHFADRMNDDRNKPEIKVAEIQALFKKIARKKAVNIKKHKNSEVVLKDIQKDLNLPVAIKAGKDGELDVVHKTIMRKKNFKTPNPVVQYEETNEAFEKIMTGLNEALEVEVDEGKVDFETDKDLPNLRRPKRTTDYEFKRFLMKTAKNKEKDSVRFGTSRGRDYSSHIGFRGEDVSESALLDTKVVKTLPAPKRGGEIVIRKHNKENKFFVRLKYTGKSAKGSRPENLGTFSSLDDAMKKIKKMNIISEADPCWSGYKQVGMKKNAAGRDVPNCVPEAVSPAQQAAIAIAKKKSGKYDKEGKRIDEAPRVPRKKGQPAGSDKHSDLYTDENPKGTIHGLKFATEKDAEESVAKIKSSDRSHAHKIQAAIAMEQRARVAGKTAAAGVYRSYINDMKKKTKEMKEGADILQSPRPGIRIVIRKHTDGKRFVFRPMTQGTPGEVKILDKKTAEKQISALKRMGWKKAANEEGGAGEEGTYELVRKYKKDTPMQENEIANATKERHNDEKERLKRKHDRELDRARLRDTRNKNMDEEFEKLFEEPCCDDCAEDEYGWTEETDFIAINEGAAEYQGRKVKLNNPTRSDNPKKKTMVYVKNDKGNVVKVYFGDPNLSIKRDDPNRRKNFRARHNCDNPGPKWKARYWSCRFWSSKKVSDLMKG